MGARPESLVHLRQRMAAVAAKHDVPRQRLDEATATWLREYGYAFVTDVSGGDGFEGFMHWYNTSRAKVRHAAVQLLEALDEDDAFIAVGENVELLSALRKLRDELAEPSKPKGRPTKPAWLRGLVRVLVAAWPRQKQYKIEHLSPEGRKGTYSESPLWAFVNDALHAVGVNVPPGTIDTVLREYATRHAR